MNVIYSNTKFYRNPLATVGYDIILCITLKFIPYLSKVRVGRLSVHTHPSFRSSKRDKFITNKRFRMTSPLNTLGQVKTVSPVNEKHR